MEVPDRVHHELAHLSHFTHSFAFFRSTYIELEIKESLGPIFELVENMYLHEINRNHLESHDRYDLRVEIFMEQEWRFGLDLGRLASTLSNVAKIFCLNSPLKHSVSIVYCFDSLFVLTLIITDFKPVLKKKVRDEKETLLQQTAGFKRQLRM